MDVRNNFGKYAGVIAALPSLVGKSEDLPLGLLMETDGRFSVYYAPFDHIMTTAKIVLVGITPGKQQAAEAINTARILLQYGHTHEQACERAKAAASFAGPMRSNLVAMLDHVGIPALLGITSTSELWSSRTELVHFTSSLRYPVLKDGGNFTGAGILGQQILLRQIDTYFAAECATLPSALFVPLGDAAAMACQRMVDRGALKSGQILSGLAHPSPANAERVNYFLGKKAAADLSSKTNAAKIDAGRVEAMRVVQQWAASPID